MVKKGNKRSLEGAEAPVKPSLNGKQPAKKLKVTNELVSNGLPKKNPKDKKPQVKPKENEKPKIIESVKLNTKNTIKVEKEQPQEKSPVKKVKSKEISPEMLEKKLAAKKRKKELRKQARLEKGQYKPQNMKLTEEQIQERIKEIQSKGTPSRTARRKLAVMKKKLRILQGTYTVLPPVKKMSESVKRKIRRHKNSVMRAEKLKNIEGVTDADKQKNLEEKAKNVAELVKQAKSGDKKGEQKKEKNVAIKAEPEGDDDEDDDDEEEEEEDDDESEEEDSENVDSSALNTSAEATSQDDEDDDDDEDEEKDEEEEEEEEDDESEGEVAVPSPAKKIQKPIVNNVKPEKAKPVQQQKQAPEKPVQQQKQSPEKKSRYVLFVGNLSYTATQDDIKKHFLTKVSEVCSVRIPTDPKTNNPRGFAYVEFTNNIDYEKGLSLHESELQGRRINVQYSTSGSKNSGKKPNVVAKNQKLHALRKQGKLAGSVKESNKRNFRRNKQNRQGV